MTLSSSRLAYTAEEDLLNEALAHPRGIRIPCASYDAALNQRHRMNKLRVIARADNREVFAKGDPGYGQSEWDHFVLRIRTERDCVYLYVEPQTMPRFEAVPEGPVPELVKAPAKALPAPLAQLEFKRRV